MYKPLSRNKRYLIRKMHSRGMAVQEIADIFRISAKTVRSVIGDQAKPAPKKEPDPEEYCTKNSRCWICKYRTSLGSGEIGCFYAVHEKQRRGCSVKDCDKFVKGNPPKEHVAIPRRYE